jgi:hypothetical protein
LLKKIGSVPGKPWDFISKVHVACFFKLLDLVLRSNFIEHGLERIILKKLILDPLEFTANPENRLLPRDHVEIRSPLIVHEFEECIYLRHKCPPEEIGLSLYMGQIHLFKPQNPVPGFVENPILILTISDFDIFRAHSPS